MSKCEILPFSEAIHIIERYNVFINALWEGGRFHCTICRGQVLYLREDDVTARKRGVYNE